jgi:hypothetical protein
MRPSWRVLSAGLAACLGLLFSSADASAENVLKRPNAHPDYVAELEPHGTIALWRRAYTRRARAFGDPEFGAGFRATIEILDEGFIPDLNNTVGISFGFDITSCGRWCRRDFSLYLPVAALQWNFFFTEHWSAFAEPGFTLRTDGFYDYVYPDPVFLLGGRYHFNDDVSLTMRIGYPYISFGVSFFVG